MKRSVLVLICILVAHAHVFPIPEGVTFSIRYYDKSIYFQDSPIYVRAEVRNDSASIFRFRIASNRVFNLEMEARTLSNTALDGSQEFIIQRNTNQPVFYRDMALHPGEHYAFIEDLTDYVTIPGPGVYIARATFYPELWGTGEDEQMRSNSLTVSVRPGARTPEAEIEAQIDEETGEILQAAALPPDEVVRYVLRARQRGMWEQFFLYLDVEQLLLNNPQLRRRYQRSSEEQRLQMLQEFREDLKQERVDRDIVLVPTSFEIVRTSYTPEQGTVTVIERFEYPDYTEIREYTYYLQRRDGLWYIYNYDVRNLGTE